MKLTKSFIKILESDTINQLKKLNESDIVNIIQQANYKYYNSDAPIFSDEIYDKIHDYLEDLNPNNPILKNIGSSINKDTTNKANLPYFMGSLDKIKADEKTLDKFKTTYKNEYIVSDKLDGNSAMIQATKGKVKMFSRGDGIIGQDISHLLPFIRHIPILCVCENDFTIRGELIISKDNFKKLEGYANARNTVSGIVNAILPDLEVTKLIEFVAYEIINPILTPENQMKELQKKGFKCVNSIIIKENDLNITKLSQILIDRKKNSEFEIDGIVIYHNAIHPRSKDGNPKNGFAFKNIVTMDSAEVIVKEVEWNLSKDGYIKPTVLFDSVNISGSTISRATGFHAKFIVDNKIGEGSKVFIIKSGDVIPKIEKVLSQSTSGEADMPKNIDYIWNDTKVDIMIKNKTEPNKEIDLKNIEYFFKKMEIPGFGPGNILKIYDTGYNTIGKIFNMKKEDFLQVPGFKNTMADKLFEAIQKKRNNIDCITMMDASNILGRGFSTKKIELIVSEYPNIISKNYIPTLQELIKIKGIEKKTGTQFIENLPKYFKFLKDIKLNCISNYLVKPVEISNKPVNIIKPVEIPTTTSPKQQNLFLNQAVIFSGFRSKVFEDYIKSQGGRVVTSISSKTTLLIYKPSKSGEKSGKVEEAEEKNIKIMTLSEFENKYKIYIDQKN